jgi:FtsP/CotA-like multicopper oxidase with cupredoxin domain
MTRLAESHSGITDTVMDPFTSDVIGLPEPVSTETIELEAGDTFDLTAGPVRKRLGEAEVRMLAYNGSIPGPTLKVAQGSEVVVNVTNETDVETTVHWHGLRLENRFDGVPRDHHGAQEPIPVGGSFAYKLRFPDPGIYWYHPHFREDYTQELGLYGNIIVVPNEPDYWSPVNREVPLVLDDILLEGSKVAPFSRSESNRTAMGRYGNVMLLNGETAYSLEARRGETVRFYLTNTANARPLNFRIPGARMKLVGGDSGRLEREELIEEVLIAPSERAVVDVLFEEEGRLLIENRTPDRTSTLGTIIVREELIEQSYAAEFFTLRAAAELLAERDKIRADMERDPDKTLALVAVMPGMTQHEGGHGHVDIEWEDTMQLHNQMSSPRNMLWKLVDRATGAENNEICWSFRVGDRVKLRILNEPHSDHPMQHPFHMHGERFLVLSRDGAPNQNLVWKDSVLIRTGETVDLLVEMSNPGTWMAHCHIAEHLEGGMMLTYQVLD